MTNLKLFESGCWLGRQLSSKPTKPSSRSGECVEIAENGRIAARAARLTFLLFLRRQIGCRRRSFVARLCDARLWARLLFSRFLFLLQFLILPLDQRDQRIASSLQLQRCSALQKPVKPFGAKNEKS